MANGDVLGVIRAKLPKSVSILVSAAFFIGTLLINVASNKTHIADVQAEHEKRLTALESAAKNDLATRRELEDLKTNLKRVEDKLDKQSDFLRGAVIYKIRDRASGPGISDGGEHR